MKISVLLFSLCALVATSTSSGFSSRTVNNRAAAIKRAILIKLGLTKIPKLRLFTLAERRRNTDTARLIQTFKASCAISNINEEHSERMRLWFDITSVNWDSSKILTAKLSLYIDRLQSEEGVISSRGLPYGAFPEATAQLGHKLRVKVYQITSEKFNNYQKQLVDSSVMNSKDRWIFVDLKSTVEDWVAESNSNHGIEVSVEGNLCNVLNASHVFGSPTCQETTSTRSSHTHPKLDIITVSTSPARRLTRQASESYACYGQHIFVDLSDPDLNVIRPRGFNTLRCIGTCTNTFPPPVAIPNERFTCQPTSLSSMSILYEDEQNEPKKLDIPDVKVERCGCIMFGRHDVLPYY